MKREMGKAHSLAVKCIDKMRNKLLEKFYMSCCLSKSMPIPQWHVQLSKSWKATNPSKFEDFQT